MRKGLPIKRTMAGFICLASAIAPAVAMGYFITPDADAIFDTAAMINMFKWQGGLGILGMGLIASAFDKYDQLVAEEKSDG